MISGMDALTEYVRKNLSYTSDSDVDFNIASRCSACIEYLQNGGAELDITALPDIVGVCAALFCQDTITGIGAEPSKAFEMLATQICLMGNSRVGNSGDG